MNTQTGYQDEGFSSVRMRGFFHRILDVMAGHPYQLMAYDEVRDKLHLGGPVYRGLETVRIEKIIGSVNRYRDFDRRFLPTQSHTKDRWVRINRAWYQEISLPPVLLYKVGPNYFVVDGNHRVSVARNKGQLYIEAEVRECVARVPITQDLKPGDLIRLGERVEFLERTNVDRIRPEADIETTITGGYDRLIEHIAVHRYFMGIDQGREIAEAEAVGHWFDTLYLPVTKVIEESGILQEFPDRTAGDLYLWTMDHLHYLRNQSQVGSVDVTKAAEDTIRMLDHE